MRDERNGEEYPVGIPPEPAWYRGRTGRGTLMKEVGVLQGTYLGIYVSNSCMYWYGEEAGTAGSAPRDSTSEAEVAQKDLGDVVEVAARAKAESGVTFVHLNTGYQNQGVVKQIARLGSASVRKEMGALVGIIGRAARGPGGSSPVRLAARPRRRSLLVLLRVPRSRGVRAPPARQASTVGQQAFFRAIEYCQSRMPRGACSGEIIAGVEPVETTKRAIDYITAWRVSDRLHLQARLLGSAMEHVDRGAGAMKEGLHVPPGRAVTRVGLPVGTCRIQVSLVVQPEEAAERVPPTLGRATTTKLAAMRTLRDRTSRGGAAEGGFFRRRLRPVSPPRRARSASAVSSFTTKPSGVVTTRSSLPQRLMTRMAVSTRFVPVSSAISCPRARAESRRGPRPDAPGATRA